MVKSITCGVRRVDGPEEEYVFDSRPISESILSICKGLKLPYDEEDNYHVLVAGNEATAPLVTTRAQLLEAKERGKTPLVVQRGSDLVKARLRVLQGTGDLNDRLSGLLVAVRGDAWLAEEVVAHNGIRVVVEVALTCAWRHVELAMTCLCEIFRNGHVNTWVEKNADEFTPKLFRQLFSVLFPLPHARAKQETKIPPHASLCICIFLLQRLPGAARSAHAAAVGAGKFGDSAEAVHEAYYSPMLDAMDAEDDDFQRGAAESVLSAMAVAGAGDEQLRSAMQKELVVLAGRDSEVGGTAILSRCSDRSYFMERMLMTSMGACVELAMAYSRNTEQSKALENYRTIERRVERMHEVSESMKEQVRKQHQIMCRMVPFMQIESDPVVEPSLDGIIRFGWDSLHWKRGYSMLHYCAESVEDPAVVELIGLLATEVDKPDDDNMRPIDYARRSGREAIVRVIERLRRQRRDGEGKEEEPKGEVVNVEALRHRLEEMGDLPQELKKALEVQLDHCGSSIEWPSDFTAAHLAAKKGHVSALELLADAGAELATRDIWRLTPLDYAVQGQHESAILTIQRILADRNKPSPQPRLSGSSVDHAPPEGRGRSNSRLRRGAVSGAAGANRRGAGESEDDGGEMYFTTGEGEDAGDDNEAAEAEAPSQLHVELFSSFEEPSPEDRAQMVIPEGLGPELQKSCEAVRRKGWAKIKWGATNFTALHLAAQCGSMEVVTFLLKASAAPSLLAEDHKSCTPLTWAVNKGHEEVASLLRAAQTAYEARTAPEVAADEPAEEAANTPAAPEVESAPPPGPTPEDSAETPAPPAAETKSTASAVPGHAGISAGAPSPAALQRKSMAASMMGEASRTDGEHPEHWKNVRDLLRKSRATVAFTGQTSQDVLSSLGQHRRTRRGSEDFGVVELRQEVKKLSVEKHMWQEERAELLGRRGSAVKGVTLSETFDQSTLQNFVIQLETFGREAVISKLMRPTMTGGLALDQAGAKSVCDQLEMVMKCCEARSNRVKALGDALAGSARSDSLRLRVEETGLLGLDLCQQLQDVAMAAAAVVLCQDCGMEAVEERTLELREACEPQPEELAPPLWRRTRELFVAGARLACAEARGLPTARHLRLYERRAGGLGGYGRVGSGRGPKGAAAYAQAVGGLIPATVVCLTTCRDALPPGDIVTRPLTPRGCDGAEGVFTSALVACVRERPEHTWESLVERMGHACAQQGYAVSIGASRALDLRQNLSVVNLAPNGRQRALLVGISYFNTKCELHGCHEDVRAMRQNLGRLGLQNAELCVLMDDGSNSEPSKANIIRGFQWLTAAARPGDSLFFHFSGHGSTICYDDWNEEDGADECICPVDHETAGVISDCETFEYLLAPLPAGVLLTLAVDRWHGGTILELPYVHRTGQPRGDALQPNVSFDFGKLARVLNAGQRGVASA